MASILPPQQHKQSSRKGKRAWRKNVDITAVQAGLESLREEVLQGGPIAEKDSKDIFAVDTIGSEEIRKTHKLQKPLKADKILAQRSAVPVVDGRKRPISRITDGVVEPGSKRQKRDWVSKKEVQRLREAAQGGSQLTSERLEEDEPGAFDLWRDQQELAVEKSKVSEFIPKPKPMVAPRTLQKAPIAMTASGKPVPAVANPAAGTSYNPLFEAWDDLLTVEGQKEVEAEKVRIKQERLEAEKQARIDVIAAKEEAGQYTDGESAWEGFETDESSKRLKAKRAERKTQAERNKIKRRKEAERQAKHEEKMGARKKQAAEIEAALRAAQQGGSSKDLARVDDVEDKYDEVDDGILRRRRMGTAAIPKKTLELVLPDELQDSLRRLKPEGNLLNDRFRHLLVNGKIEARKPITQPKKRRIKYTEKWAYKDFSVRV